MQTGVQVIQRDDQRDQQPIDETVLVVDGIRITDRRPLGEERYFQPGAVADDHLPVEFLRCSIPRTQLLVGIAQRIGDRGELCRGSNLQTVECVEVRIAERTKPGDQMAAHTNVTDRKTVV